MKFNLISALCGVMVCSFLSANAMANQATFINASPGGHPVMVVYEIAHKNPGGATVYSAPQTVKLQDSEVILFDMQGYQLAGVVPISIGGHVLDQSVNEFDNAKRCSLTTDAQHHIGSLAIAYTAYSNEHGTISCKVEGGIFN